MFPVRAAAARDGGAFTDALKKKYFGGFFFSSLSLGERSRFPPRPEQTLLGQSAKRLRAPPRQCGVKLLLPTDTEAGVLFFLPWVIHGDSSKRHHKQALPDILQALYMILATSHHIDYRQISYFSHEASFNNRSCGIYLFYLWINSVRCVWSADSQDDLCP